MPEIPNGIRHSFSGQEQIIRKSAINHLEYKPISSFHYCGTAVSLLLNICLTVMKQLFHSNETTNMYARND